MPDLGVEVVNLKPFVRELKKAQGDFGKHMRVAGMKVAQPVAESARGLLSSGPGQAPTTARTVRAGATQNSAFIRFGGNPTAMGDEFGSIRYKQFRGWRGSGPDAGYGVYEAIRQASRSGEIEKAFLDAVDEAVAHAFPD